MLYNIQKWSQMNTKRKKYTQQEEMKNKKLYHIVLRLVVF